MLKSLEKSPGSRWTKMIDFIMKVTCHQCWENDNDCPGDNSIELDPLPIREFKYASTTIDQIRQRELIERHGWIVDGDNAFCSAECANDYYENLKQQEREDIMRDGD